jgi:hypothetical protein
VEAEEFSSQGLAVDDFGNPFRAAEQIPRLRTVSLWIVQAVLVVLRLGIAGRAGRNFFVCLDFFWFEKRNEFSAQARAPAVHDSGKSALDVASHGTDKVLAF